MPKPRNFTDLVCMECDEPATYKCLKCSELTCNEHLSHHPNADGKCPGEIEDEG